jgi:hypothetical protein
MGKLRILRTFHPIPSLDLFLTLVTGITRKRPRTQFRRANSTIRCFQTRPSPLHPLGTRRRYFRSRRQPAHPRMHRHRRHGQTSQDLEHYRRSIIGDWQAKRQSRHVSRFRRRKFTSFCELAYFNCE